MIDSYKEAKFLLVAGSRTVNPSRSAIGFRNIVSFLERHDASPRFIVHGNARGADQIGTALRHHLNADCIVFDAVWRKHGMSAGYRRNEQMAEFLPAEHSLACIFVHADTESDSIRPRWSKGSTHMYDLCKNHGIRTKIFYV